MCRRVMGMNRAGLREIATDFNTPFSANMLRALPM